MRLLIDGNNVIHSPMPIALEGMGVEGLCRALARTAWAKQPVTVVCDGYPQPLGLLESPEPGVELLFARRRTADAMIIERIDRDPRPRQLTVVSSDREIRLAARERGSRSWTSDDFLARLDAAIRSRRRPASPARPSPGPLSDADVDRWLRDFGFGDEARPPR